MVNPNCVCVFQTGDRSGELTARMNVSDLQMVLGLSYRTNDSTLSENPIKDMDHNLHGARPRIGRRNSMENLELMKLTPDKINVSYWLQMCNLRLLFTRHSGNSKCTINPTLVKLITHGTFLKCIVLSL